MPTPPGPTAHEELVTLRVQGRLARRDFLRLLAAGGVAALPGCFSSPRERVEPFVRDPLGAAPGQAWHYATALPLPGGATGLLVRAREGRPIKVEGNPDHPASLGAAGLWEQASLLGLYDPRRARQVLERGRPSALEHLRRALSELAASLDAGRGAGLHLLLGPSTSPLLGELLARLRTRLPEATVRWFDPLAAPGPREAMRLAFGEPLRLRTDLRQAEVVASLDDDFLGQGPERLRLAREWADRRVPGAPMGRLYVAECGRGLAGCVADHRLALRSSEVHALTLALVRELRSAGVRGLPEAPDAPLSEAGARWARALARDLAAHRQRSVVRVGEGQPASVHLLALAMNQALGNLGRSVLPSPSPELAPAEGEGALAALAEEARQGRVKALLIDAFDPVYAAPAGLDLGSALASVPVVVQRSLYPDETSLYATWFVPASHPLESWGDVRSADGTVSLIQPLVSPLYPSLTTEEVLSALVDGPGRSGHDLLQASWRARRSADFETFWRGALRSGVVEGTATPAVKATLRMEALTAALGPGPTRGGLEVNFRPDLKVRAGEFAHNAWLQECPDPVTQVTWDNPVQLGTETAKALGVETGSEVEVRVGERRLVASAYVVPGHAEDALTLALGYGQTLVDAGEAPVGVNAYRLRADGAWFTSSATSVRATGRRRELALIQITTSDQARPLAISADLSRLAEKQRALEEHRGPQPTLYRPYDEPGYRWAMAIDLTRCVGCQACVVACQSENNVPVVGPEEVSRGREMHWLRVDTYYAATPGEPEVSFHPLACVHCENAPCEYVCPVNATVHSDEGLNEMVYNRCVGTRYCSNNCPYKVRRFNWRAFNEGLTPVEQLGKNPEVTVRSRGVMEKCTYCVQRIEHARIQSKLEGRTIRDGEVQTACAQACPTRAITFGTLSDEGAAVSRLHRDARHYFVLRELGTRPRTAYLARVTNRNPDLGEP